jgi:hypothetical protein
MNYQSSYSNIEERFLVNSVEKMARKNLSVGEKKAE